MADPLAYYFSVSIEHSLPDWVAATLAVRIREAEEVLRIGASLK